VKASLFRMEKRRRLFKGPFYLKMALIQKEGFLLQQKRAFELIESIKKQNEEACIKIYATGIFRKLNEEAKISFIDEFFKNRALLQHY